MKNTILLISILLINTLFSQEINYSKEFQLYSRLESFKTVVDCKNENILILTHKANIENLNDENLYFYLFDKEMNLLNSKQIDIPSIENKKLQFVNLITIEKKSFLITKYFDSNKGEIVVYSSEINTENLSLVKHYEILKVNDNKVNEKNSDVFITISKDSSKIFFAYKYNTKKDENSRFSGVMTDIDFNTLWTNDIILEKEINEIEISKFLVDKNSNLHFSIECKEKKEFFKPILYSYYPNEKLLKKYDLDLTNYSVYKYELLINDQNELILSGLISDQFDKLKVIRGTYFIRINTNDMEVLSQKKELLDNELYYKIKSRNKSLMDIVLKKTYILSDGSLALLCEDYRYDFSSDGLDHHARDFFIIYLNDEGRYIKNIYFKKAQKQKTFLYNGIMSIQVNDKIFIAYNDNASNDELIKNGNDPENYKIDETVTTLIQIDENYNILNYKIDYPKDIINTLYTPYNKISSFNNQFYFICRSSSFGFTEKFNLINFKY